MYGQYRGKGANSVSIVGRLSTLRSVHYQRFHCIVIWVPSQLANGDAVVQFQFIPPSDIAIDFIPIHFCGNLYWILVM